jgi:hypothetical protein
LRLPRVVPGQHRDDIILSAIWYFEFLDWFRNIVKLTPVRG